MSPTSDKSTDPHSGPTEEKAIIAAESADVEVIRLRHELAELRAELEVKKAQLVILMRPLS